MFLYVKPENLFYICVLAYILNLLFESLFLKKSKNIVIETEKNTHSFFSVLKHRYSRQIAFFLLLSSIIGFLIHYAFIIITADNFQNPVGLIKFFGVFMSTMVLFMFFADKYLLNRILNNLGLPYSIILSPIFTGIFIVFALLIGWKFGYNELLTGYTFFFMFFAAGKYIESLFKYSVETPSANILITPIDSVNRVALKEFIQGPVVAAGLLFAGLIIFLKSFLVEFNLLFLSVVIIGLSVIWFLVSVRLIKKYRNNLKLRFAEIGINSDVPDYFAQPVSVENLIFENFQENNDEKSLYVLKLLKPLAPSIYFRYILNYLNPHRKETLMSYVLNEIERYNLSQALPTLQDFKIAKNEELKERIENIIQYLDVLPSKEYTYDKLVDVIFSSDIKEKKQIIKLITERNDEDIEKLMPMILKDIEPDVVFLGMIQAKNLKIENCLEIISEYLLNDIHYALAFDVLKSFGDTAVQYIEDLYYSDDIDQKTMKRLIRLLGEINSDTAIPGLIDKLDESDYEIKKVVIEALRRHKFKARGDQVNIIIRQIVKEVENCTWNMTIHLSFREFEKNEKIILALNKEINENIIQIFGLLSLLYDNRKLNYIYNQILDGNSEILVYAIELLDFILDEDLKNIIFPLFENTSYNTKINQLQYYFPVEVSEKEENLSKVLNRESNLLSPWIKACVIYYCLDSKYSVSIRELVACFFHPVPVVRETAAFVLYNKYPVEGPSAYKRLPEDVRSEIDISMEFAKISPQHLIYNRIIKLKSYSLALNNLNDGLMTKLVTFLEPLYIEKDDVYYINDDDYVSLVWVFSGKIKVTNKLSLIYKFDEDSITDLNVIPNVQTIIAKESSILYILKRNKLNELLFDNKDFLIAFLEYMNKDKIFQDEGLISHYEKVLI